MKILITLNTFFKEFKLTFKILIDLVLTMSRVNVIIRIIVIKITAIKKINIQFFIMIGKPNFIIFYLILNYIKIILFQCCIFRKF